jgi:hypothetical protein
MRPSFPFTLRSSAVQGWGYDNAPTTLDRSLTEKKAPGEITMPHMQTQDPMPNEIRNLLTDLIILDRQTGQPRVPSEIDDEARAWLIQVLLDELARQVHLDKLRSGYGGRFRLPPPHWERPSGQRIAVDPSSGFQWFDLLPEEKTRALLDHGPTPAVLDAAALARLLLNPFGLWDLAERIDTELPEWWLQEMDVRGKAWLEEQGLELRVPPIDTESEDEPLGAALAGMRQCRVGLASPGPNCWELTFSDDAEAVALRRAFAAQLYGDPQTQCTFRLYAHRLAEENAAVPFSLQVQPAPTRGAVTVRLEFPGAALREFRLEPPETYPGVEPPETYRSARCAPVPASALSFTEIIWGDHPDDRHLLATPK